MFQSLIQMLKQCHTLQMLVSMTILLQGTSLGWLAIMTCLSTYLNISKSILVEICQDVGNDLC